MTTIYMEKRSNPFGKIFFWGLILTFIVGVILVFCHAGDKHGESTVATIQDCLDRNGAMIKMENVFTGRTAEVCNIDVGEYDGKFGVKITCTGSDVMITCFVKEKMHSLGQVIKYLMNAGYTP